MVWNDTVRVLTRRGNDWTDRFKKIAADAWLIKADSAIIDGEVVMPAPGRHLRFQSTAESVAVIQAVARTSLLCVRFVVLKRQRYAEAAVGRTEGCTA